MCVFACCIMRSHKTSSNNNKRPLLLHLVCSAVLFSLFVFAIQSSFFTGFSFLSFFLSLKFVTLYTHTQISILSYSKLQCVASGNQNQSDLNREEVRVLSEFQSSVQQCVVSINFFTHFPLNLPFLH